MADSLTIPPLSRWQLAASSAFSPFALVIVSPLLPELRRMYTATEADVQYVLSAYLIGLGVAQLILGALSDRYGRRIVLLVSLTAFAVMSVICAYAPTLETLIVARFFQACGAAGSAAICRASVHDVHHGDTAAYYMSYIAVAHSMSHTLAPVVGGYAGDVIGFAGLFLGLSMLALAMMAWSWQAMPETRARVSGGPPFSVWHLLVINGRLMKSPVFVCYAMIYGLTGAPFFAFLASAPSFFADTFAIQGAAFGAYWSSMSLAFLAGAMTSARLVKRIGRQKLIGWTMCGVACVGVSWPILVNAIGATPIILIAPLVILSGLLGLITPLTLSGAIAAHPNFAGAASGLCGALTMATSAALSIIGGHYYDGTGLGLTWPMSASAVVMLGFYLALRIFERREDLPTEIGFRS